MRIGSTNLYRLAQQGYKPEFARTLEDVDLKLVIMKDRSKAGIEIDFGSDHNGWKTIGWAVRDTGNVMKVGAV